ncbi:hypothetical protein RSAG8_04563, partial [Rhizoctonia solani AG-8 WAC10335]
MFDYSISISRSLLHEIYQKRCSKRITIGTQTEPGMGTYSSEVRLKLNSLLVSQQAQCGEHSERKDVALKRKSVA